MSPSRWARPNLFCVRREAHRPENAIAVSSGSRPVSRACESSIAFRDSALWPLPNEASVTKSIQWIGTVLANQRSSEPADVRKPTQESCKRQEML